MRVLSMILAGGKGRRLYPLTRHRTKPAVPFGGNFRIIDFVISNLVNAGLDSIYVLVQYRAQSLIEHLRTGWHTRGITIDQFITVVPPQMRHGEVWYRGSADAIAQNLNLIQTFRPDVVAVLAGDLVFRMDVQQMVDFHTRAGAEATIACSPVPIPDAAGRLGVAVADSDGRVSGFVEKPKEPGPVVNRSTHTLASMGCFLFEPSLLIERLAETVHREGPLDLSADVLPKIVARGRTYAYDFETNRIPGQKPYEKIGYWRDVGTLKSFWAAHMDLLGDQPTFDLLNPEWPIYPARVNMPPTSLHGSTIDESLVGEGGRIRNATIRRSVIGRGVTIDDGATVEESIVMDYTHVGAGCHLRRAILDRHNRIAPGSQVRPDAPPFDERVVFSPGKDLVAVPRGGIAAPPEEFPYSEDDPDGLGTF